MSVEKFKKSLTAFVDIFYLPFLRPFIPLETFRYGFCGSANLVIDGLCYFLFYQFVFRCQDLDLGFIVVSAPIASFLATFPIVYFTGFWLTKNISFQNTSTKTTSQGIKYFLVVLLNIGVKYFGLKFLVLVVALLPSVANIIMTIVTVVISYILQRFFTFKAD